MINIAATSKQETVYTEAGMELINTSRQYIDNLLSKKDIINLKKERIMLIDHQKMELDKEKIVLIDELKTQENELDNLITGLSSVHANLSKFKARHYKEKNPDQINAQIHDIDAQINKDI